MPSIKKPSTFKAAAVPKSKRDGATSKKTTQPKTVGRIQIRFGESRKASPIGYLSLDDALNLLGEKEYPKEWGAHQIWEEHPFRYKLQEKVAVRYALKQRKNGEFKLCSSPVDQAFSRNELKAAHQTYRSVARRLKNAFEMGEVTAAKFFRDGTIQIVQPRDGIWAAQINTIFYTGYAHGARESRPAKFRILVDKASLERLLSPPEQTLPSKGNRAHLRRFLDYLAPKLTSRANQMEYRFKRDPLRQIIVEVLAENNLLLGEPNFKTLLWSQVRGDAQKPGRRAEEETDSFEHDKVELKNFIRDCYRTFAFQDAT